MDEAAASGGVVREVAARVGLVGNPSDGFGGAVLSAVVPALVATVTACASDDVAVRGPLMTERWDSPAAWRHEFEHVRAHVAQRIISASLWTLVAHLRRIDPSLAERGTTVSWHTDIPTSVGLAGSSALAVGTIDAVSSCWGITLDRRVCAALALAAERDVLGIAAGWQDRIVQAFGCTVLCDAATMDEVDGESVPLVHAVTVAGLTRPPVHLVVGWHTASAASSDDYHAPIRRDPHALAAPMAALAALARAATASLERGDLDRFAAAVDEGWRLRQSCVPLRADHAAIVELVRAAGVPATTPGSGGSVVACCTDEAMAARAHEVLAAGGCTALDLTI